MLFPSRTSLKIVAVAVGIFATAIPVVFFNGWLKSQGDDELALTTAWALAASEMQLGQAVGALKDLSARGVDSCRPVHVEAMRQAALRTGPVKQVMAIGPNGEVLCTDTGATAARLEVLTSAATSSPDIMLDVVQMPDRGERLVRVRKLGPPNKSSLAAVIPASLLLPQAPMLGGRKPGALRVTMIEGTPIGDADVTPDAVTKEKHFTETQRSQQYPIAVTVSMPRGGVIARHDDLRRIAIVMTGAMALVILFFALLLVRRQPADPSADIAKAVRDDEFVPYYQPLVDLQSGRLLGAEVLVRWRRGDGRIVEPNAFILMLESSGLVLDFTRKLMRRACKDVGDAFGQRPNMKIAFNVAPRHFDDALILHDIGTIFDGSPIRLSQVVLELTERHEVVNLAAMRRTVAALQRIGCKVAIDDVGTGHSGLSYILKLGVDIIKIDKMFVDGIGEEGHSKPIIETLIDLAKSMRMEIVAEGVETFDQVTYLRDRGIGAAQGHVFAPALPASSFLQLLDAMDPISAPIAGGVGKPHAKAKPRAGVGVKPAKSVSGIQVGGTAKAVKSAADG